MYILYFARSFSCQFGQESNKRLSKGGGWRTSKEKKGRKGRKEERKPQ